jgi:hypothetical protein
MKRWWLCLSLLVLALPAAASDMDWSMIGSAGKVDEDSLTLYECTGARIKFKSTATGTITVRATGSGAPPKALRSPGKTF